MTPERYARLDLLLDGASEVPEPERAEWLAGECADDPDLAWEVERLLALEDDDSGRNFLAEPALDQAARDLVVPAHGALTGHAFAHYDVVEYLGGGMSEVYRAHDRKLGRDVVLKLLPAGMSDPDAMTRLAREARTLSSLNHPHVVTIHDVDAVDGRVFLATEYVEGQTLRARLADGPLPVAEAVAIARQIALALEASHAAGVLHRDVKPDNVMVRPDGVVKVLDFGIAKVVQGTGEPGATAAGTTLGTPGYMSPEQIRGAEVDARSDVFALGVVLYEMLSGRAPFAGDTPADGMAATLSQEPLTLAPLTPAVPEALQQVVMRALQKRAGDRFADVREFRVTLEAAVEAAREGTREASGSWGRRVVAAVAALVVLGIAAALFIAVGRTGPREVRLSDRDVILLGPFTNGTAEEVFDASLRRALIGQLEQSPFLALFGEERVRASLRLMKQPADQALSAALARDVCLRNGIKAYVTGAIDPAGGRYLLTLEAFEAESGRVIGRSQAEAANRDEVLAALRAAAAGLRARLGETLASIRQFDPPVDQVTTSSLDALESYALGREAMLRGRAPEAIALLTRAVEIDADFAVAWAQLSAVYANAGNDPRAADTATRAYALRDGVSERERLYITQRYHRFGDGDLDQAIASLELARGLFPRDPTTRINLASHFLLIGRPGDALPEAQTAIALNPDNVAAYTNAATALVVLGRVADARTTLDEAVRRGLMAPGPNAIRNALAFNDGDAGPTLAQPAAVAGTPREAEALNAAAAAAGVLGQWPRASVATRHAVDRAARIDATLAARFAFEGSMRAAAYGRCAEARGLAAETARLTTQAWFLSGAAMALALCGQVDGAERLAARILELRPKDTLVVLAGAPTVRALNALTRRDPDTALAALQHLAPYEGGLYAGYWPAYVRGRALLAAGRAAEAVAQLEEVATHRGQLLMGTFTPPLPLVELDLARAQSAAGETVAARATYDRVLATWHDADPELPQRRQARAERERLR